MRGTARAISMVALGLGVGIHGGPALAQDNANAAGESVGRGWPVEMQESYRLAPNPDADDPDSFGSQPGEVPEGVTPLPVDIYTSTDFYQDQENWTDPRYYRCSRGAREEGVAVEDTPWGRCDWGVPREAIVSPYPFATAQEHYEALLAETESGGGPTLYTDEALPDWDGVWTRVERNRIRNSDLTGPTATFDDYDLQYPLWVNYFAEPSVLASLLTPEYQTRFVQQFYHDWARDRSNWPLSYCWPEGYLRLWFGANDPIVIINQPEQMTLITQSIASAIRMVYNNREFITDETGVPRLAESPPRWYGESIGFWDDDAYIVWTSNVQGWMSHQLFEHSSQMQTIEIFTPEEREDGLWLKQETIFYDSEALLEPVRQIMEWHRVEDPGAGRPYSYTECLQTVFPIEGTPQQVPSGQTIEFTVPDYFGRPWAALWEEYFEQDMSPPEEEDIFGGFN